ncbi:MAG: RNA polymerase sigma factor [Dehalococcoidia bacterium]|nr:RNA polymerase sigma factor [Dehalococcoidia bacterium]
MILPRLFRTYLWMMAQAMVAEGGHGAGVPGNGDEEGVNRLKSRREVFADMYDTHMPGIYRYICYRVGNASLAEDLTADVFEKALKHIESYRREKAAPSTWLTTIARNTVTDYFRKSSRIQVVREDDAPEIPQEGPGIDEQMARIEEAKQLRRGLSLLPQLDQDIISLKFGTGLNNREIARTLKVSESNVGTRLYRAVKRLRDSFEEWNNEAQ